jgi:hypothetical protein
MDPPNSPKTNRSAEDAEDEGSAEGVEDGESCRRREGEPIRKETPKAGTAMR